jgi:uncharacterized repeat protein (TIGR01451 family)
MHNLLFKILRRSGIMAGALLVLAARSPAATPSDMSLKVTGASFKVGRLGRYTVTVANRGKQVTDDAVHVLTTLPAGLTLARQKGADWVCSANGQDVDCVTQRIFRAGRTSTFRLWVQVCDAAFPAVFTSFRVSYAADPNAANNVASRSTVIRSGTCAAGGVTPTNAPGAPTATRTPVAGGTRTPTPTPGGTDAPVMTSFTCNGDTQCTVSAGQSFPLQFSFSDPNGNAISWRIVARRDDGYTNQVGYGNLGVPTGSKTVSLQYPGFICSFAHCREDVWEFSVTASDTTGLTSAPVSVTITVLGS